MTPLQESADGLRLTWPDFSASRTLSRRQTIVMVALAVVIIVAALLEPAALIVTAFAGTTLLYLATLIYRTALLRVALRDPSVVRVTDAEARGIPDDDLPVYTVLIPAYHEAQVIERIVAAIERLEYPVDRLDVKLLLEADDRQTIAAARAVRTRLDLDIVLVPAGKPRTKPKACNFGLTRARGELVTIYDAEDQPEPLQLRRVVAAFRRLPSLVGCLQAKLSYHNVSQNLLTRWFTAEYETWFSLMLPALARIGGPIPLGGTSMHIPRSVLEAIGGWDAYNVTEDADLGVRLQRLGYTVAVLNSTTLEEANSDVVNWVKQRSRWYKGYLQTWLVHMRHPVRLWQEVGPRPFLGITLLLAAIPLVALINPIFWLLTAVWFLTEPASLAALLPPFVYYPALVSMLAGNFLALYVNVVAIRITGRPSLLPAVLLSPVYWLLMSIAALRAVLQLVINPSFWEKSVHGLDAAAAPPLVTEHGHR